MRISIQVDLVENWSMNQILIELEIVLRNIAKQDTDKVSQRKGADSLSNGDKSNNLYRQTSSYGRRIILFLNV